MHISNINCYGTPFSQERIRKRYISSKSCITGKKRHSKNYNSLIENSIQSAAQHQMGKKEKTMDGECSMLLEKNLSI